MQRNFVKSCILCTRIRIVKNMPTFQLWVLQEELNSSKGKKHQLMKIPQATLIQWKTKSKDSSKKSSLWWVDCNLNKESPIKIPLPLPLRWLQLCINMLLKKLTNKHALKWNYWNSKSVFLTYKMVSNIMLQVRLTLEWLFLFLKTR